jgi:hypothetical protein
MSVEQINTGLLTGSEVSAKSIQDANAFQNCAGNILRYRVGGSLVTLGVPGTVTFPALIPLRPPLCVYQVTVTLTSMSSNGNVWCTVGNQQINQASPGGAIGQTITSSSTSQSIIGNVISFTKNASRDALDVAITIATTNANTTYQAEFVAVCNKLF